MTDTRKLVLFDVDGTLVDSQNHIAAAMEVAFAEVGVPLPDRARILSIVGLSLPQAMAVLAPQASEDQRNALVDAYKSAFARVRAGGAAQSPLFPGARDVLACLADRADTVLGVATGKSRRGLDHVLSSHGLQGVFATEQVADNHPSKPHPAMVQTALTETGTAAARAVMIGDTTFDIEMGRAAGLRTIGVSWGYHPVDHLITAGADRVIDHFDALIAVLDEIWGQAA